MTGSPHDRESTATEVARIDKYRIDPSAIDPATRRRVRALLATCIALWLALFALLVAWHRADPGVLAVMAAPLALPLLMLRGDERSLRRALFGACLAALLYFSHGVMVAMDTAAVDRAYGFVEIALAVALVLSYSTIGRLERRAARKSG